LRFFQTEEAKGTLVVAAVVALIVVMSASAQQSGVTRTPLQTVDFPPGYQTVSVIVEITPGTCAGRHTHPGIETNYSMEGEIVLKIDGSWTRL
jgi:quercetin dioxygenase-like cupin family protein